MCEPDVKALPRVAREIAECIGVDATLKLLREYGGQTLRVPKTPRAGSRIVRAIGMQEAARFAHYFGGEQLHVPVARKDDARRKEVLELVRNGKISKTEAARRLGMTVRWIRELVNREGRETRA